MTETQRSNLLIIAYDYAYSDTRFRYGKSQRDESHCGKVTNLQPKITDIYNRNTLSSLQLTPLIRKRNALSFRIRHTKEC